MSIEKLKQKIENLKLDKYQLEKKEVLNDINGIGLALRHKKSGARLALVVNDDDNKVFCIGFRTPAFNDTGTQHIIEHSTLCGSSKYPVKDPFVELAKGSLNTFLNAMTYPDKTIYPVASCNDTDFKNIIDVYMDAVFNPNMYKNEKIFRQEGWHYELESREDDLKYNGIVFNEMKGVYSSPDDILANHITEALFPDTEYSNESGGKPEHITDLTYEDFLAYHKKYYHPKNSYIYLYGNFDIEERLDYLDKEYLSHYDKDEVELDSELHIQERVPEDKDLEFYYPISDDEEESNATYLSKNWIVAKSTDVKLISALSVIDYCLTMAQGAYIKEAMTEAGIGDDVDSTLEANMMQPMYTIEAINADISDKDKFDQVIRDCLVKIVEQGIDQDMALAGLNSIEFKYREADYGRFPKGLIYGIGMYSTWLYDDSRVFDLINQGNIFEELKEEIKKGYLEEVIKTYLLDNEYSVLVSLKPKKGMQEEIEEDERARLAKLKEKMSDQDLDAIIAATKDLKAYQSENSSQEDLNSIPLLEVSDIERKPAEVYNQETKIGDLKTVRHNIFTNKIVYACLSYDAKGLDMEEIPYLGLLSDLLASLDTENYSYGKLSNQIDLKSGGISVSPVCYSNDENTDRVRLSLEFGLKSMYDTCYDAFELMYELMMRTKFTDKKRIREIIKRVRSGLENNFSSSAHRIAILIANSQFSLASNFRNRYAGYEYYKFIADFDDHFDQYFDQVIDKIGKIMDKICQKSNLIISLTADDEGYEIASKAIAAIFEKLPDREVEEKVKKIDELAERRAYTIPSQVQYVACCGNAPKIGPYSKGAVRVLNTILSYEYLWVNIRLKGGAYGGMCSLSSYKDTPSTFVSYRDPNLEETIEAYKRIGDYVRNFEASQRDMAKFIIGTMGEIDTPLNPMSKGLRSFNIYMKGRSYDEIAENRAQILDCKIEDIRNLADYMESIINANHIVVVGGENKIKEKSELFDSIEALKKG